MPPSDSLRETLEIFRAQEKKVTEDLKAIRFTIRNIERAAGIEGADLDSLESSEVSARVDVVPPPPVLVGGKPKLRVLQVASI